MREGERERELKSMIDIDIDRYEETKIDRDRWVPTHIPTNLSIFLPVYALCVTFLNWGQSQENGWHMQNEKILLLWRPLGRMPIFIYGRCGGRYWPSVVLMKGAKGTGLVTEIVTRPTINKSGKPFFDECMSIITGMSQKFCNILITWGTIGQLRVLLSKSWRLPATLNYKKPNTSETLWVLLTGIAAWKMDSKSSLNRTWPCLIIKLDLVPENVLLLWISVHST